ncbi:hypothetical protein [Algoriphagus sp. NBT04N3]|uniref:hypothetical protein n=1 Tax=Algoriphagus sp. NBT04N3 TaxID=2705473 RepID=UPI00351D08EA
MVFPHTKLYLFALASILVPSVYTLNPHCGFKEIIQSLLVAILILASGVVYAQQPALQYFRPNDKNGLNVFEPSKEDTVIFDGLKVRVGGDFAMQFQGIRQSNTAGNLTKLGSDFNLPSANLNLDV